MGMNAPTGLINATLPAVGGVEGDPAGSKTSRGATLPFSCGCSSGRECLTCASQVSRGENGGVLALLGSARSVTGNARLRGMRDMSVAGSRADGNADLIPGGSPMRRSDRCQWLCERRR